MGEARLTRPFQGEMSGQSRPRPDGLGWMKRPFRPKTETSYHNAVLFLDRFLVGVQQVCHCFGVLAEAVLLTLRMANDGPGWWSLLVPKRTSSGTPTSPKVCHCFGGVAEAVPPFRRAARQTHVAAWLTLPRGETG